MSHDRDRGYVISLYIYIYTNIYALQCVAVCCSVLQCVAVCCSVLQCTRIEDMSHDRDRRYVTDCVILSETETEDMSHHSTLTLSP